MTDNDLLAAVDALTKPVLLVRWQETDHDHEWIRVTRPMTADERAHAKKHHQPATPAPTELWRCSWCDMTTETPTHNSVGTTIRRRTELPLLEQLQNMIAASSETGGPGKPGRERVPIDASAFDLYEMIDGRIRSWLDDLGARPGKSVTTGQALRSWFVLWAAGQHDEKLEARHRTILDGWAGQIRDKLQPPRRIEITAPCPVCGKEWINVGLKLADGKDDPEDVEMVRVLNAVERETLEDSYALCSACQTVWAGVGRMRQLRIDIDDKTGAA